MEYIKSALYFLAVLSVLVIVHEWGHFIVAKLCKMRVEDFSLFFGKKLICLGVRNGTEYNIRSVPLGGFVRIAGMEPEDISNGAPIFKRVQGKTRGSHKTLRGLDDENLRLVNFDNVSDRVGEEVEKAIGDDARLSEQGRWELQALLASTAINADEHRYIQAVLNAVEPALDPDGYNQKPLWQRAAVIFAGPFMSLFFGYILFCVMGFTTGMPYSSRIENLIVAISKDKPADRAGLKPGDRITQIEGKPINDGQGMVDIIHASIDKPLHVTALRDGDTVQLTVTPKAGQVTELVNDKPVKKTVGLIGITPKETMLFKRYTPVEAVRRGTQIIYIQVYMTFATLFSRHAAENVGGIITIGRQIHDDSKEGARQVLLTAASLSISLGIINLFPIPILDGGHLMLLAWEGLRRRKLSSREVYAAQMVGLSVIGVLFVLVMYNDIMKLFPHSR